MTEPQPEREQLPLAVNEPDLDGSLRATAVSSVGWTAGAQLGAQAIQLVSSLVITRLLVPADFGLSGMILVFFGLATLFSDFGLHQALVQRPTLETSHLTSAFWAQAGLGLVASFAAIVAAPLIAGFYDEPRLVVIATAMSPSFLLSALGTVPQALLVRRFMFRQLAMTRVGTTIAAGGASVIVAAAGGGVWALVTGYVLTAAGSSALAWSLSGWRPAGRPSRAALGDLAGFGSRIFGFSLMSYGTQNLDNLLIGRWFGSGPLGIYLRSFTLVLTPSRQVSASLGQVMFSAFSRLAGQIDRTKSIYLRTIGALAVVFFPLMIGTAVVADEFVIVAFGDEWLAAIDLVRIFCCLGAVSPLFATIGWIYQSQGRADLLLWWGVAAGSAYMGAVAVGALLGSIEAVALAVLASYVVLLYPGFAIPGRLIGMRFSEMLRVTAGPAGATAAMVAVTVTVNEVSSSMSPVARLALQAGAGATTYFAAALVFRVGPLQDLMTVGREALRRRSASSP